jgi:hypothetical protein
MKITKQIIAAISVFGLLGLPALAFAQDDDDDLDEEVLDEDVIETDDAEPLPPPTSTDEPRPPVALPSPPPGGIVRQAGIGSPTGYGRAGVLELGGFAGLTAATDFLSTNVSPTIGWFFADNMQISAILGLAHLRTDDDSATMVSVLAEPSYHVPFNRSVFGFLGLGLGAAYQQGQGLGFAMAPRIGANIMVGRSGVLSPALSYQYNSHDTAEMEGDRYTVMSTALAATIGYTVMW